MYRTLKYILLFCVFSIDALKLVCDYTNYFNVGWFRYYEIPMTWSEANMYCQRQGAMLASPTTYTLRFIMKEMMIKNELSKRDIFTGIYASASTEYYNIIEGKALSDIPHSWADSEPNTQEGTKRCVALNSNGYISNVKCNELRPFICYVQNTNREYDRKINICGTDPEYQHDNRTNKCYKLQKMPKNFSEAKEACSAEGGHLAIINSAEESKVIADIFARNPVDKISGDFWKQHAAIGFFYDNDKWVTIQGQLIEDAGYSKFDVGEPNNQQNDEYCGSVNRMGLLNDAPCSYRYMSICEKDPYYPPVCSTNVSTKST